MTKPNMQCSAVQKAGKCTPAAEYTVFTGSRGTARTAPLSAIEVVGATQQLNQVHAHITVQVIVLSDDLLNATLHSTKA